jgi:hypothetical protein
MTRLLERISRLKTGTEDHETSRIEESESCPSL